MSSIDVIVPCYRYGRYLEQCVRSVLAQTAVDIRVLIIDDASPDNTAEVGQDLARQDPRITFVRHANNRGNIATYNEGIDWVSADYYLLLSADDYLLPGSLSRASGVLDSHDEVVLTCGKAAVARAGKPQPSIPFQGNVASYEIISGREFIEQTCERSYIGPIWTPTAVVRTSAQKLLEGYKAELPHAADLELWLRLARLGSIAILKTYQAVWRVHGSNMHRSYQGIPNLLQHRMAFESALANYPIELSDQAALEKKYKRGLAIGAIAAANFALNKNDKAGFREAVAFAIEVDPAIRHTLRWGGMRLRGILGHRLINFARSIKRMTMFKWRSEEDWR